MAETWRLGREIFGLISIRVKQSATRGLVVHRTFYEPPDQRVSWSVTHLQSGKVICRFPAEELAFKFAAMLGKAGCDWRSSEAAVMLDIPEDRQRAIARKCRAMLGLWGCTDRDDPAEGYGEEATALDDQGASNYSARVEG